MKTLKISSSCAIAGADKVAAPIAVQKNERSTRQIVEQGMLSLGCRYGKGRQPAILIVANAARNMMTPKLGSSRFSEWS